MSTFKLPNGAIVHRDTWVDVPTEVTIPERRELIPAQVINGEDIDEAELVTPAGTEMQLIQKRVMDLTPSERGAV